MMRSLLILLAALALGYYAGRHDVIPARLLAPARPAPIARATAATPAPSREWMFDPDRQAQALRAPQPKGGVR